ncbi:enoyl-CoA hydratase/isomerase family protein [Halobacteriovorax sp.]|uniref:enoyl-CoA hydratase/isomerase family protein n=1 Tax=Halobacteriovorax sp. TaxID=2020862 RepID=UPI003569A7B3
MSLFSYNTLSVELSKETRSISIKLNRPEVQNAINTEMIFELETLFTWISTHLEIKSIYLSGTGDYFCKGLDDKEFSTWTEEKRQKNFEKLQKLIYSMFFLPQTIIADLKKGCAGLGLELAMGADIRVSHKETEVEFNHLSKGIVPSCGGISFTSAVTNNSTARQWLLLSKKLNATDLVTHHITVESYDDFSPIQNFLKTINSQPDVARIQAKRSLLEPILKNLDQGLEWEKKFSIAGMCTNDWKEIAIHGEDAETVSAKELSSRLKRERAEQMSSGQ